MILEEIKKIKSDKKSLREFGLTVGGILVILGLIALWRHKGSWPYLLVPGAALVILGLTVPAALLPFQKAWMAFAVVIGYFMSRVILVLLFYAVITPIGVIARLFGKDMLDERIDKSRPSYWKVRNVSSKDKKSYENQF
jgi:hypothetical protein